jgi:RNA polymerase sigma-70 factor (ECF subfamily)
MSQTAEVTVLLRACSEGNRAALEQLAPLIDDELRRVASVYMRSRRAGNTLQTSALVNAAYLRLVNVKDTACRDRTHFFALSAQIVRRILVDGARARLSAERGGGKRGDHAATVDLDAIPDLGGQKGHELLALDHALKGLAKLDPRRSRVIELRFFGGLSIEETAEVLKISPRGVLRDWRLAKTWLLRAMRQARI